MANPAECVVVVLDGTDRTAHLVRDLAASGAHVTAVGRNFADVVAVLSGNVYAVVADLSDPEQWATVCDRAVQRYGTVGRVVDPANRLLASAA